MKTLKRLTVVLALLGLILAPISTLQAVDKYYNFKDTAQSTTSTVITFGFQAKSILVSNRNASGGAVLYVDWAGGTANSSDNEIDAAASRSYTATEGPTGAIIGMRTIAIACASGTCSVQVLALR